MTEGVEVFVEVGERLFGKVRIGRAGDAFEGIDGLAEIRCIVEGGRAALPDGGGIAPGAAGRGLQVALVEGIDLVEQYAEDVALPVFAADLAALLDHFGQPTVAH